MATVLVVDDEEDVLELVKVSLELDGRRVVTASNGVEALRVLEREQPDIVVLDVMMPAMDGWEVLSEIKARRDHLADTPVLMLTARRSDMDRIRGGIEGAIRYLTKPFDVDELVREVREALEGDPEPARRRAVQQQSLERLARLEKGDDAGPSTGPRPHLTRLGRSASQPEEPARPPAPLVDLSLLPTLSDKQSELLHMVASTVRVTDAAETLGVSRSNVYASLRRIARKLDVRSVEELVRLARSGAFSDGTGS